MVAMFERFTERARRVIILAQEEAKRLNHNSVGSHHILLGIIREGEGVASKVLESLTISSEHLRVEVEAAVGRGERAPHEEVAFTPRAKKVLEFALDEARRLGHNYIGTEHLLLGLIREGDGVAGRVLEAMGADLDRVRGQVVYLLGEQGTTAYTPEAPRPAAFPSAMTPVESVVADVGGVSEPASYAPVPFTPGALGAMAHALREAVRSGHASVGAGHLLLGLISDDQGVATRALVSLGVDLVALRETTETLLREHGGTG